jgi:hypothetical protein
MQQVTTDAILGLIPFQKSLENRINIMLGWCIQEVSSTRNELLFSLSFV